MSGNYRGPGSSVAAETVNLEGDKGDITVSNAGETWTIDSNAVTFPKIQNVATDTLLGRSTSGTGNVETITCTAAGRALLDDADAATQRATLGITALGVQDPSNVDITGGSIVGIDDLAVADGGTGASSAADARTNLGLVIGSNVLAYDANLQSFVNTFTLPTADSTSGFYLKTDGAGNLGFQAPGGLADGDYGDITVSGGGAVWSIDADTITTTELANNAVETANITDLNVTTGKLADLAVTAGKLASDSVTTAKILDSNVTNAKLANAYINDLGSVTFDYSADFVAIADSSDSGNKKKALLSHSPLVDIDASVAANALTITINPVTLDFRSTTLTDGTPTRVNLSSAASVVVPSTATLGTINAQAARLVVLAINNAGTIEAAVVNLAGGTQLDETNLITTTTIGTGADSSNVAYSTTGRTNVAYRVVGFIDITEATAGTWATAPTLVQPTGGQALAALSSIGYGQTWQSVAGSRSSGVTYYNTTGKPICVSIFTNGALASTDISLTVNGIIVAYGRFSVAGNTGRAVCQAIVPPGGSYEAIISGTFAWVELR